DQPDEEITHDYVMDHCVIHGSVNKVVDQILALREEIGDFGELVYAGMDWVEPALNKRSMQLMAEEVMPRVNAAIGKAAAAARPLPSPREAKRSGERVARALSAFTRVCDALWRGPGEGQHFQRKCCCVSTPLAPHPARALRRSPPSPRFAGRGWRPSSPLD